MKAFLFEQVLINATVGSRRQWTIDSRQAGLCSHYVCNKDHMTHTQHAMECSGTNIVPRLSTNELSM